MARSRSSTDYLLLIGFCGFLFFFGLAYFGLIGADEPRYAQVAREMLARHDWVTPTLGGIPWLEKPVLYYWQAMLAYAIFGVSDWAARLPSAVDATLMVAGVYVFLRRFRPGLELDGALIAASTAGVIGFARAASMDMPLAAMFTLGLLSWLAWHESGNRRALALFYVFLGLATLAKGPVAPFLAAGIIALFAWSKGEFRLVWQTLWIPGIVLFGVVALPWYVAVQIRNPEFFRVFILEHNLARFGTNLYHHEEPFWYYLPVCLLGLLPWMVFVLAALVESIRLALAKGRAWMAAEGPFRGFFAIWLIAPVLFFSASQSKLPGYILLALPAGALLLVEYLGTHLGGEGRPSLALVLAHAIAAVAPIVPVVMMQYIILQHHLPWRAGTWIAGIFAAVIAIGIILTLHGRLGLRGLRFVTLIPVILVVAAALRIGAPALDAKLSARPLAQEIGRVETTPMTLAVFRVSRETEYGLQFYRNQIIPRYGAKIPQGEHLVVGPAGSQTAIAKRVPGRRVSYLGHFAAQDLDYFWVAASR
jgi:4-amino-4-deoxy-L-arabinose transferase-like glycosyltransferase